MKRVRQASLLDDFYSGKKVLVTGLVLPPQTRPSHFDLIGLNNLIGQINADICHMKTVQQVFDEAKPEIVCASYRRFYFDTKDSGPHPGLATARAGNVIGGGESIRRRGQDIRHEH